MPKKTSLLTAQTTNDVLGPFNLKGTHIIAINGVFGGATLKIFHRMPTSANPGPSDNLPQDSDLQYTSAPPPFPLICSSGLPVFVEVTGATGTTNLNCIAFLADET